MHLTIIVLLLGLQQIEASLNSLRENHSVEEEMVGHLLIPNP